MPTQDTYKAIIKAFGRTFVAEGETVTEAIANIKAPNYKGRGVIILEHGEKKKERVLMPLIASRLFNSHGISREVALKQMALMFEGL